MIAFLFSRSNGVSARRRSIIIGAVSRVSCPEETRSPRHIKIGENVGARPSSAYFPARRGARFESRSHSRGRSRRSFRPKRGFLGSVSGGHRRPAGRRSKKNAGLALAYVRELRDARSAVDLSRSCAQTGDRMRDSFHSTAVRPTLRDVT